ncbi:MAG TPA: 50S ribosomal protein L4 [Flavitalea sp.]|nr:50S ribosomal protein L4 [Flavitalea sp.]
MQVDILNIKGEKTGRSVDLPDEIFGVEPNDHVIYLAVKQYLAAQRQGTSKVKTRLEVKGSSKKLHRQKGTGGARKGNLRNPLYKGGGTIFGPKPRDYDFKLNYKVKGLAKCSALSHKVKENSLMVVEDVKLESPKTKEVAGILKTLKAANRKLLVLTGDQENNFRLSFRNIPNVKGYQFNDMNTYDIVNSNLVLITESAANLIISDVKEIGSN